jgi:hypothetical protein
MIAGKLSKDETIKAEKAARDAFEIAYNEMMGRTLAPAEGSTRLGVK